MKTARPLLAVLGTLLATLVLVVPAQAQQDRYEQFAHDLHIPGLAVVEFDANGITDEHYVGVDGNNNPITADSLFIWGSVSKSFTGALALELADKRLIDLNAPVTQYYPEFRNTAFGNNGATITDLIHHTSGLPRELGIYPRNCQKSLKQSKNSKTSTPPAAILTPTSDTSFFNTPWNEQPGKATANYSPTTSTQPPEFRRSAPAKKQPKRVPLKDMCLSTWATVQCQTQFVMPKQVKAILRARGVN